MIAGITMSTQVISEEFDWPLSHPFYCLFSIFAQYAIPDTTILSLLSLAVHIFLQLTPSVSSKVIDRLTLTNLLKLVMPWTVTSTFWTITIFYLAKTNRIDLKRCLIHPTIEFEVRGEFTKTLKRI